MKEIVELTRRLVGFKTMHGHADEIRRCVQFMEIWLNDRGIAFHRLEYGNLPSLMVLPRQDYAPVLLMSHIDVVDASDDLFTAVERDGRLYGRGTKDDKYAVALSLVMVYHYLEKLRKQGKDQADMPFGLLITSDEETGGRSGAAVALRTLRTEFGIALDGGDLNTVIVKEKGLFQLRLIARGKAAHGARPWSGVNAAEILMEDYGKIRALFEPSALEYPVTDHWHRTVNLGILRAGKSTNQVPDLAEAALDIRFTEHDDIDALFAEMQRRIRGELVVQSRDNLFDGGASPYLDLLLEIAPDARTDAEHGASDARYLSEHGIPGVVWGASGGDIHSPDEYVDIASLQVLSDILMAYMDRVMQQIHQ